jgi:CubicO group peptidase (beta-lactamase class C family)
VAKQFTAAAIALLVQDGKLKLEDDIRTYLPEVPDFGHRITVRYLLNHTSGLRDQWGLLSIVGSPPGSAVHTLDLIVYLISRQHDLNFTPNDEFLYSNTGYALLAVIVKRVSGKSLAEFTAERLFRPLGMTHTQWRDDFTRVVKGRATAYSEEHGAFHSDMPFTMVYGNGGLLSTVGDWLIWNHHLNQDRTLGSFLETQGRLNSGRQISYALGLTVTDYRGVPEVSHGGATAGYRTFLARYPTQHLSVALLCNLGNINPEQLAHQVAEVFLTGLAPRPTAEAGAKLSAEELTRYTGVYRDPVRDNLIRVGSREGRLVASRGGPPANLVAVGSRRFRLAQGRTELEFEESGGRVTGLKETSAESDPVHLERLEPMKEVRLDDYAGTYHADELDAVYTVSAKDGALWVTLQPEAPVKLTPIYPDGFQGPGRTIRFSRDGTGRVTGFGIFAGRVRNVRFTRQ